MKALPFAYGWRSCAGIAASTLAFFLSSPAVQAWTSAKVQVDASGHLTYPADASGNRIPDFSNAGYMGGGVPLPTVPVVKTILPVAGDNTAAIQAAIDAVGAMPVQANGYRGALLLSAGLYGVTGTLHLNHTGVVLAGVGNGSDPKTNTVLQRTGTSTAEVIIAGGGSADNFKTAVAGSTSNITDAIVPVGSHSFNVANPALYKIGDSIVIFHPSTQAWINAVDTSKVWTAGQADIHYLRTITAISGTTITVDAPVFNALDKSLAQSTVYKYDRSGFVTNAGIQNLFIDIVTSGATSENHCTDVITFVEAENCWIRDVVDQHFVHAGVMFGGTAIHCTALNCRALDPNSIITGGRRYNFATYHAQCVLFDSCYGREARHTYVANGTSDDSCVVFLNCTIDHPHAASEGHRLWSTGLLYDGIKTVNYVSADAPDVLGLYNRGTFGSGHGWAAANSVMWNCNAAGGHVMCQQPPTAQNYAIGCFGKVDGNGPFAGGPGFIEGTGVSGLQPASLYQAQLADRLGATQQAAAPTFSPAAGTYTGAQSVSINTTTAGASIRYTTDGSTPTETNGTVYTGTPVTISVTTTLQAIAYENGFTDSGVTSATYTITMPQAAAPTFNPGAGAYNNDLSVAITSATPGASVNYTTDGTTPTETHGIPAGGSITINATTTLQAIAFASGFADSTVSIAPYTLIVAPVTFSPPAGIYSGPQSVTLSTVTNGAIIHYTIDGSTPTATTGTLFSAPVTVNATTTIKAIASKAGYSDSPVTSVIYTISLPQAAAPVFSPTAGTYATAQNVTITSATSSASIRYTTDGSTPSETAGTFYSGPVHISATTTLKAIAYAAGFADSTITSGTYAFGSPPTLNFEAESLSYTGSGATTSVQTDKNSSGGKWVELAGNSVGDNITFTVPNIPAGTYQLKMEWKGNNSRGILQLAVDGANLSPTLDQYASGQTYPTTTFGNVTFSAAGNHTVRLTVTGKNSKSSTYQLSADKFTFTGQ